MYVRSTNRDIDVFIAGAGPAGLACAIAAATHGFHVEVADGRMPPIDKACGEGVMPDTIAALAQLGIDLDQPSSQEILQSVGYPLRGIRFLGNASTTRNATTTEAAFPSGQGRGVSRILLHQLLLNRALSLGVRFHWLTVVHRFEGNEVQSIHNKIHATLRARWFFVAASHLTRNHTFA